MKKNDQINFIISTVTMMKFPIAQGCLPVKIYFLKEL